MPIRADSSHPNALEIAGIVPHLSALGRFAPACTIPFHSSVNLECMSMTLKPVYFFEFTGIDFKNIPPCRAVLYNKVRRSNYIAKMIKSANQNFIEFGHLVIMVGR